MQLMAQGNNSLPCGLHLSPRSHELFWSYRIPVKAVSARPYIEQFLVCGRLGEWWWWLQISLGYGRWQDCRRCVKVKRFRSPEQVISELRGVTCHMGSHHTVLPAIRHKRTQPA